MEITLLRGRLATLRTGENYLFAVWRLDDVEALLKQLDALTKDEDAPEGDDGERQEKPRYIPAVLLSGVWQLNIRALMEKHKGL